MVYEYGGYTHIRTTEIVGDSDLEQLSSVLAGTNGEDVVPYELDTTEVTERYFSEPATPHHNPYTFLVIGAKATRGIHDRTNDPTNMAYVEYAAKATVYQESLGKVTGLPSIVLLNPHRGEAPIDPNAVAEDLLPDSLVQEALANHPANRREFRYFSSIE